MVMRKHQYLEHETTSAEDRAAAKLARKKNVGKNPSGLARRKNSKARARESIMTMPFDIVFEIAANLSPGDLLNMARTSKVLRKFFTTKQPKPIWHAARQGVGLPECFADVSEMKFADLIFCKGCNHCGSPRADMLSLPCRLRLCRQCCFKRFKTKAYLSTVLKGTDWFFSLLPVSVFEHFHGERYKVDEAKELQKQLLCINLNEVSAFVAGRKQLVSNVMQNAEKVKAWMEVQQKRKEDEKMAIISERTRNIYKRLYESGYSYADCGGTGNYYKMGKEWIRLFKDPKPLTDRIWKKLEPKLELIILLRRLVRRTLGHAMDCNCFDCERPECFEDSECECENCMGGYSSDEF